MRQLTLRVSETLAEQLKRQAAETNRSMNSYASAVLAAAVDPDLASDEATRVRERLARAGLLTTGTTPKRARPDAREVARARARAGRGRPLSEIVAEDRR